MSPATDRLHNLVAEVVADMFKLLHPQTFMRLVRPTCLWMRPRNLLKGNQKMKSSLGIKIAAVAAFAALAGCTDLKPLQADIDSLKSQVGTLSSDVAALKADKSAANSAAAASAKADAAQSTANQALSAAQAAQAGVNDLNEKINRMFQRSVSK
jgi:outer membrane murein-binding lipoprotein Lpp